jgi:hypothetical protein
MAGSSGTPAATGGAVAVVAAGGPAVSGGGGQNRGGGGAAPRRDMTAQMNRSLRGRRVPIWILGEDKLLRPTVVKLGLTDGIATEIADGKLKQGDKIIIGLEFDPNRPATTNTTTRPPGFGGPMGGMGGGRGR